MNRTGKTNAKKGAHKDYNAYKDFHEREVEGHIIASFMTYAGMEKMEGLSFSFLIGQWELLPYLDFIKMCDVI